MNSDGYLLQKNILLVDDEQELLDMVVSILNEYGFHHIRTAKSMKEAIQVIQKYRPEFSILDVMLPDGSGFALMEQIKRYSDCPILLLTACGEEHDLFKGFALGADDYIVKPFNPMELFARVNAWLRRVDSKNNNKIIKSGNLELNIETCEVFRSGKIIDLTGQEYKLLEFLMKNKNKVFTTDILLERIWNDNEYYDNNIVSVYISRLRDKIGDRDCEKKHIITIRGLGYKFNE